jgi:hypothetical protein
MKRLLLLFILISINLLSVEVKLDIEANKNLFFIFSSSTNYEIKSNNENCILIDDKYSKQKEVFQKAIYIKSINYENCKNKDLGIIVKYGNQKEYIIPVSLPKTKSNNLINKNEIDNKFKIHAMFTPSGILMIEIISGIPVKMPEETHGRASQQLNIEKGRASQRENNKLSIEINQLKKDIKSLKKFKEEQELNAIRQEANAQEEVKSDDFDITKTYSSGQTSQQALNPEISVVGDFSIKANIADPPSNGDNRSGAFFRSAGFHIQSDLDPFSKTFIAFGVSPSGISLGEAFVDWSGILPSITFRVGKFLQNFGVLNRWHMGALDQFDTPLALQVLLGGRINQMGVSIHWMMPSLWATSNELYIEITNAQNATLFEGKYYSPIPSTLLRLVNYYDLGESAYINLGLSGMAGTNQVYNGFDSTGTAKNDNRRFTFVGGIDLTFLYEKAQTAKYKSFLWRSEFYYVHKELENDEQIKAYGAYSYIENKFTDRLSLGLRFDYTQPLELENSDKYIYQVVPYLTYAQSPWVKWRLQYNLKDGSEMEKMDHSVVLQLIWAVGPHKHERY